MLTSLFTLRSTIRYLLLVGLVWSSVALPDSAKAQSSSPSSLIQYEAQLVHFTNLKRQEHGIPPLRWNRELSLAAREFSRDAVVNQPSGFCGHTDSQGRMPGDRFRDHGYANMSAWGENVICGLVAPKSAIVGWTNSEQHRAHLLDPNFREVGIGYYRDAETGLGYVTQDLSADPAYAPVIIELEAIHTESPTVNLYIYSPAETNGFDGIGPAAEMLIANTPDFAGAVWEPYQATRTWQLEAGEGWRTVYVKLRDTLGRTTTSWDTIYLGSEPATDELALEQASAIQNTATFPTLQAEGKTHAQFRLNWLADNRDESFSVHTGAVEQVADDGALGGSAAKMSPGIESKVELYTYRFLKDMPLNAVVRLKVNDTQPAGEAARVTINAGGVEYGPLTIAASDFTAAGLYQEFTLPFVFHEDRDHPFLHVYVESTGAVGVDFDAVTFFSDSVPMASPMVWSVPGGYYRGQGIWARFLDAQGNATTQMESDPGVAVIAQPEPKLAVIADGEALHFDARGGEVIPATITLDVDCVDCEGLELAAECDVAWLAMELTEQGLTISVDPAALDPASYTGTVQILARNSVDLSPVSLTVDLAVAELQPPAEDAHLAGDPAETPVVDDPAANPQPEETPAEDIEVEAEETPAEAEEAEEHDAEERVDPGPTDYKVYLPYTVNR